MIEEGEDYVLLYEDGTRVQFLPGEGKEFFSLSKYKKALGKDYRRIVLYLCTERDYEYNNDHLTDASIWTKLDEGASGFSKDVDTEIPNSPDEKRAKVIEIDDDDITLPTTDNDSMGFDGDDFLWEAEFTDEIAEELIRVATSRSLEVQSQSKQEVQLEELIETFRTSTLKEDSCSFVVLRKRLMQTCAMAIQKHNFDFAKVPKVCFSGEDAADAGGPRRELFRLLMKAVCGELGVFEGPSDNLVFSHDHLVISNRKPFLAGQIVAWSILHGGPGMHSISEDVYHLIIGQECNVDWQQQAAKAINDERCAEVANEMVKVCNGQSNFETFKTQYMDWMLDHGISPRMKDDKQSLLMQIIKEALLYRYF